MYTLRILVVVALVVVNLPIDLQSDLMPNVRKDWDLLQKLRDDMDTHNNTTYLNFGS